MHGKKNQENNVAIIGLSSGQNIETQVITVVCNIAKDIRITLMNSDIKMMRVGWEGLSEPRMEYSPRGSFSPYQKRSDQYSWKTARNC